MASVESPTQVVNERRTTRERLVLAAVQLLQQHGAEAVTTTALTQEAGIVQSGFYSHFTSVDACLGEAITRVVEEVRSPIQAWLDELRSHGPGEEDQAVERLTEHYLRVLVLLGPRWPVFEMLARHRRSAGPLGAALAAVHGELVGDVRDYLRALVRQEGLVSRGAVPQLELLASLIVGLVETSLEATHRQPKLSPRWTAQLLASSTQELVTGTLDLMRAAQSD